LSAPAKRPEGVEPNFPLGRLTTIRTGGAAEWFALAGALDRLERLLKWASEERLDVGVVGSGSNLLVADQGVRGLVVKLDGELARIDHEGGHPGSRGSHLVCGGGARLPQASARAAALGLTGLEFGVNIPGTVGGAVKMNANAYGGELGRVLDWVDVSTPAGTEMRRPEDLGFSYRRSNLGPREVVARASFALEPSTPETVRASLADMRDRRREAQPSGIKTFGSTFKNPDPDDPDAGGRTAGRLLEEAGCKGLQLGGARFSPKHANFIENIDGRATTTDVLALIAEGRRRVRERFGVALEPEVQLLGDARFEFEAPDQAR
jgi:UDP-N-acetylmuramate dehydrogenase